MFVLSFSEAYTLWRALFIRTLDNSIVTKTFLSCNAHAHHSQFAGTCWESQTNLLKYIVMLFRKAKSFSVGYRFPRLSPKACFPWWFRRVSSPRSLLPFGCQNVVGRASVIKWFWKNSAPPKCEDCLPRENENISSKAKQPLVWKIGIVL